MGHCCVPGCKFLERQKMRKKGNLNIPNDRLFAVKRPDLAKSEEQKKHRQNITNIILSLAIPNTSKGYTIEEMLQKEAAKICECHFPPEDFYFEKTRKVLRLGAIPILDMPKITYQMEMRIKELKDKREMENNKSGETQTAVTTNNHDVRSSTLQDEEINCITLPNTNDLSGKSILISLKQQMWNFIIELMEYSASLSQVVPAEKRLAKTSKVIAEEFQRIKEIYLQDEFLNKVQNFDERTETTDFSLVDKASTFDLKRKIKTDKSSTNKKQDYPPTMTVTLPDDGSNKITINTDLYTRKTSRNKVNHNGRTVDADKVKIAKICSIESMPQMPAHTTLHSKRILTEKQKIKKRLKRTTAAAKEQAKRIREEKISKRREYYMKFKSNHEELGECYKCAVCNKVFKKWFLLRHHDRIHINANKVQCKICNKYVIAYTLQRHIHDHENQKEYICDICGAVFFHSGHLKTHIAQVTACTFPSFQCNICEEKFNKEEEYGNHFKEKHLNKMIICDLCGDEVCEKCVEDQVTLLKLYKCKFCEESFTFKEEYRSHLYALHGTLHPSPFLKQIRGYCKKKDNFLCEYCPKTFTCPKSFKSHTLKKHKEAIN